MYGCILWGPYTANDSRPYERVQWKFLRFASHVLKILCMPHDYAQIVNMLGLSSLTERRCIAVIRFINGLLNGEIESSEIILLLCFKVPLRPTRTAIPFYVPRVSTNYLISLLDV